MVYSLSIVIPFYNEEDNVAPLLDKIRSTMCRFKGRWELIMVDDGSCDSTLRKMYCAIRADEPHISVVPLSRNFGQSIAMQAGFDAAQGDLIVTMDGDQQNDPEDIPSLIDELLSRDLDMVQGWRVNRQDHWLRSFFSRVANKLIGLVTGLRLHDYGCSIKVYRREVITRIRLYGEMHRFIPVKLAEITAPQRIGEKPVRHHPRVAGKSKYNLSRTFRVILDLVTAFFFLRYTGKPGHFFGAIGLMFGAFGGVLMSYLIAIKYGLHQDIGQRPLFFVAILLIITSIQFITTGVLAELMTKTLFFSKNYKPYEVRQLIPGIGHNLTEATMDGSDRITGISGWELPPETEEKTGEKNSNEVLSKTL
jgi:glycosyltransferase involved in cell wall biosynthesis